MSILDQLRALLWRWLNNYYLEHIVLCTTPTIEMLLWSWCPRDNSLRNIIFRIIGQNYTHTHYVKIRKCICFSRHRISMSVYIKKKSGKSGWLWEKTRELRTGLDIELLFYFVSIYFFYFCPMCMNFLLTIVTIIIILKCILSGLGCKEYEQEYDKLVS